MKNAIVVLALSIVIGFYLVGEAIRYQKDFNRIVKVKGFSEKKVKSDLAIWKLGLVETTKDRRDQYVELKKQKEILREFFKKYNIQNYEFEPIRIFEDSQFDEKTNRKNIFFRGELRITVIGKNVDRIKKVSNISDEILENGANITQNSVHFLFEGLNAIKSQMIKEATLDAKMAANSFAQNANSKVGAIQKASQGYFEIKDSGTIDKWSSDKAIFKKVRVVANISFFID